VLLNFRLSNYRSIKDEQELSLLSGGRGRPRPEQDPAGERAPGWDWSVGTVVGIYGANASGKSNLLKALGFMRSAVLDSHQKWPPDGGILIPHFALDPAFRDADSLFEVNVRIDSVRYQYGFRVNSAAVSAEWLYAYPGSRRQIWFERELDDDGSPAFRFGKNFTGQNRTIADLTRPNSLFLSAGVANNHQLLRPVHNWFSRHLSLVSQDNKEERAQYTTELLKDPDWAPDVIDLIRRADLGISDIRIKNEDAPGVVESRVLDYSRLLTIVANSDTTAAILAPRGTPPRNTEFEHRAGSDLSPVVLPMDAESLGTQTLFALAGTLLSAIADGDTMLVDELDASMHPQLTAEIVTIFQNPATNPRQAQLIFTTHDTSLLGALLGDRELGREQVWFTEKRNDGSTVIYPLTDFSPRKAENLERGYLQGRYGAAPVLLEPLLSGALPSSARTEDGAGGGQ
jgi:energy-coupling factor transporter ATP-binding protein EcfA2